jgi:fumarate reductase subunit C
MSMASSICSPRNAYRRRLSTYWWTKRWPYLRFILREISSVFVAWFVLLTLMQVAALGGGAETYSDFERWLARPWVVALNAVSLLFVVFHAVTWFNLAPKAMAVRFAGKRIPGWMIALSNYAAWAAVSAALCWLLWRG